VRGAVVDALDALWYSIAVAVEDLDFSTDHEFFLAASAGRVGRDLWRQTTHK
jgi:hypothetical protein